MFTFGLITPMSRSKLSPEQREKAVMRLLEGGTVRTVAEAFGVSVSTMKRISAEAEGDRARQSETGKSVAVRLSAVEVRALERLKDRQGFGSNSEAIRALVRASSGMLEFDPEAAAKLGEIQHELRKIGVNVNQVAQAANRGRVDLLKSHWQAIHDLRSALPEVRRYLQGVVDEQRRRGTRLFQKFIEAERDQSS